MSYFDLLMYVSGSTYIYYKDYRLFAYKLDKLYAFVCYDNPSADDGTSWKEVGKMVIGRDCPVNYIESKIEDYLDQLED